MTLKHIQDQIENYAYKVALEAYKLGLQEAQKIYEQKEQLTQDGVTDALQKIVEKELL